VKPRAVLEEERSDGRRTALGVAALVSIFMSVIGVSSYDILFIKAVQMLPVIPHGLAPWLLIYATCDCRGF